MLWEREQNSAGLEYTTRLHESRKPSILKCLFHNSHKNSFFRCLGYFSKKKKQLTKRLCEALVVEKSRIAHGAQSNKKNTHIATLTQTTAEEVKKERAALREQEKRRRCRCVVVAERCTFVVGRVYDERERSTKQLYAFWGWFRAHSWNIVKFFSARDRLLLVVSTGVLFGENQQQQRQQQRLRTAPRQGEKFVKWRRKLKKKEKPQRKHKKKFSMEKKTFVICELFWKKNSFLWWIRVGDFPMNQ